MPAAEAVHQNDGIKGGGSGSGQVSVLKGSSSNPASPPSTRSKLGRPCRPWGGRRE